MIPVFVGVGSNIEPRRHIASGLDQLTTAFGPLGVSPVYESEAVGFSGPPFLNLVVRFETDRSVDELTRLLRRIEADNGHRGGCPKFSSRTLDLDLLLYGDVCGAIDGIRLPRSDVVNYAFVLWPLADLAGDWRHPECGATFGELRQRFRGSAAVRRIAFRWRAGPVSATERLPGH